MEQSNHHKMNTLDYPVLLCYSENDSEKAKEFRTMLEQNGIPCLIPNTEKPFHAMDTLELFSEILDCGCVVVLVSKHAEYQPQIHRAIELAISDNKPLAFIYLEKSILTSLPEKNLNQIRIFHAYEESEWQNRLLELLTDACMDKIKVEYVEEAIDIDDIDSQMSKWDDFCFGMQVSIIEPLIMVLICLLLVLIFRPALQELASKIIDYVIDLIGPGVFLPG